jgi:hypothetical protein
VQDLRPLLGPPPVHEHAPRLLRRLVRGLARGDHRREQLAQVRRRQGSWTSHEPPERTSKGARTGDPLIAEDLVPLVARRLGVLDAQHKQPAEARVAEDEPDPLLRELGDRRRRDLLPACAPR